MPRGRGILVRSELVLKSRIIFSLFLIGHIFVRSSVWWFVVHSDRVVAHNRLKNVDIRVQLDLKVAIRVLQTG